MVRRLASRIGGAEAVAEMQRGMVEIRRETGVDVDRLLRSLNGEAAVIATASDRVMTLGDWSGKLGEAPLPHFAVMIEMDGATLFKTMARMLPNFSARDAGNGAQFASFSDSGMMDPDYPYQPALAWDGKFLIASTDEGWLTSILAASRGEVARLVDSSAYKGVAAGLPEQGNGWGYVDAKALRIAADFFDGAIEELSARSDGWYDPSSEVRFIKEMLGLNVEPRSSAHVTVSQADGFYYVRHGGVDLNDTMNSATGAFFATIASVAFPDMVVSEAQVATRQIQNDLSAIHQATMQYAMENGFEEAADAKVPSLEELSNMGYLQTIPAPPANGQYVPAKKLPNWVNDGRETYPTFEGSETNSEWVHPDLLYWDEAEVVWTEDSEVWDEEAEMAIEEAEAALEELEAMDDYDEDWEEEGWEDTDWEEPSDDE
jgi:hypothetical protein